MMDLDNMPFLTAANYSWKRHLAQNSSFITDEFCGQLVSTLECTVCQSKRFTFDPFYDLSVPFPSAESMPNAKDQRNHGRCHFILRIHHDDDWSSCNLDDCLRAFTEPEILEEDNMAQCSKCQKPQKSTKCLQIYRFPLILVLHLKRFGNDRKKIRTSVNFPIVDFNASTLAFEATAPVYDLFAVCEHSGRLNFGHYTATCLDSSSHQWYAFNDNHVSRANPEEIGKDEAYVLFYKQRRGQNQVE
jgi:ubiquitin carboxyl-terminal hydrolase 2/21